MGVNVAVAVGVGVDVEVAIGVCVGVADAVGVKVEFGWSRCVGLEEDVTIELGVGLGTSDWESDGVAVGVGVSVGAIYGVAVGASTTARAARVCVSAGGSAGLVQASTADVAANRATIDPAMATVIGFLLGAILGCLFPEFMTRRCYTTREHDDGGCHYATAVAVVIGTDSHMCLGRSGRVRGQLPRTSESSLTSSGMVSLVP